MDHSARSPMTRGAGDLAINSNTNRNGNSNDNNNNNNNDNDSDTNSSTNSNNNSNNTQWTKSSLPLACFRCPENRPVKRRGPELCGIPPGAVGAGEIRTSLPVAEACFARRASRATRSSTPGAGRSPRAAPTAPPARTGRRRPRTG